jgi:hypothetical protein
MNDVAAGAGLLSQVTASIRVTAIGRFLRVCGVRSSCEKRNGHQASVCSHLELLPSCLECLCCGRRLGAH